MVIRRRIVTLLLLFASAMWAGGCCATNVPFAFLEENYHPKTKGGSLAVISGSTDEATQRFADHLTKNLKETSTFKVMSQADVDKRVGKYPVDIKIGEPKDPDKPVWYLPGEKAKLNALHDAVKTDYLLVVWVTNVSRVVTHSNTGSSVSYAASMIGNLVEYSPGKAVGYSEFGRSKRQSCFLFGGSEGKDIDTLLLGAAEDMADDLVSRTGMGKNK